MTSSKTLPEIKTVAFVHNVSNGDIIVRRDGSREEVIRIEIEENPRFTDAPVWLHAGKSMDYMTMELNRNDSDEHPQDVVEVVKNSATILDDIYNGTATITPEMESQYSAFNIMAHGTEIGKRSNFDATYLYIAYQMGDEFYFVAFAQNGNDLEIEEHGMMHATSVQGVMDHLQDLA
ncbi:MAG: hypothetical protein RR280_08575 [Bacteroidaceae bacterium]